MRFDIEDLKIKIRGVEEEVYVSGVVNYSVHSEGQKGTYWDPPMDDLFGVDDVMYEDILRTSDIVVPLEELTKELDESVKGWFEGDEGQAMLQSDAEKAKDSSLLEYMLAHMSYED